MAGQDSAILLILIYLLVSIRFVGLFSSLVFFTGTTFPVPVRFWLSFVLALACGPIVREAALSPAYLSSALSLALLAGREFLVGLILGGLSSAPLYALQMAGRFVGQQMGFAMASMVDPMSQNNVSVIGQVKYLLGTWFWFFWGGHLLLARGVAESLRVIPPAVPLEVLLSFGAFSLWIRELFLLTVKIVLPYFGTLLLADVGLGFVARTIPQMNVFMLGFPVKITLALLLMASIMAVFMRTGFHEAVSRFLEVAVMVMGG
jgi:flagellar biosynthetic protein FliR